MTPQSEFLILAPIRPGQVPALRRLLKTLNAQPGQADPSNALVPFGDFPTLHLARFAVLEDETLEDLAQFNVSFPGAPIYLAFLGDCDGPAESLLDAMIDRATSGLRQIFGYCQGFDDATDLKAWMLAHLTPSQASYINQPGRTVIQIREEATLHGLLADALKRIEGGTSAVAVRQRLRATFEASGLRLTPTAPSTPGWWVRQGVDLIGSALVLIVSAPLAVISSPIWLWMLRRRETTDPEITTPFNRIRRAAIAETEDHEVSNPFTAIGAIKPGAFRFVIVQIALWLLNLSCRWIYTRGRLARVGTIHFARWVVIEGRRVLFISNYDGPLYSYMDDFINKVAFGLNFVFSNGVGYPTTDFLIFRGALREEQFKAFLQHRQQLTDVWYKAYPGLTTFDLARNTQIRAGLYDDTLSEAEVTRWLALL